MRIIVGVTGASGVEMSYRLLMALKSIEDCTVHLVVSHAAKRNWALETTIPFEDFVALADVVHAPDNMAASISSGSFLTDGMIVMPCSMKSLAGIVAGYSDNLVLRAADVCLKEGRKVVLVPREMPLGKVHLANLNRAAELGCVILPPMLTFYNQAWTLNEQIDHIVGKVLMQFHLCSASFRPWKGVNGAARD